jgi:hypothetical protein
MAMKRLPSPILAGDVPGRIEGYSDKLTNLCAEMLQIDPVKRITADDIVNRLDPELGNPWKNPIVGEISVMFRGAREDEERRVCFPPGSTVRQVIEFANCHGMPGTRVTVNGKIICENDPLEKYTKSLLVVDGDLPKSGEGPKPHVLDIVFVLEATGKMDSVLQAVTNSIIAIATRARMCDRWASMRYACVCYRDPRADPQNRHQSCDFNDDPREVRNFLREVYPVGGGPPGGPVDFVGAVTEVFNLSWREDARKSIFWIGNAPHYPDQEEELNELVENLAKSDFRFIAVPAGYETPETFSRFKDIYRRVAPNLLCRILDDRTVSEYAGELTSKDIEQSLRTATVGVFADLLRDPIRREGHSSH